jgi:WD40 repeat protein
MTHDSVVHGTAFSPDGKSIASFGQERTMAKRPGLVEMWDTSSAKLLFVRQGHSDVVTCIAYSPDSQRLASGSKDGTVVIRDATTGDEILTFAAHTKGTSVSCEIADLAFSPDGNELATASYDGTVKLWDVSDAKPKRFPRP